MHQNVRFGVVRLFGRPDGVIHVSYFRMIRLSEESITSHYNYYMYSIQFNSIELHLDMFVHK